MVKFIKRILYFALFLFFTYSVFIVIWGRYSPVKKNLNYRLGLEGHTFTRLKELKKVKNVDVLFLGSSHVFRGFDNRIFEKAGYSSFSIASNGQTPIQSFFYLEKYIDSLNPKVVVFEVCPFILSRDGVEGSLVVLSNDKIDLNYSKLALKQNHLKIYNTLLFSFYQDLLFNEKSKFNEKIKDKKDTYIEGGYVENELTFYKPVTIDKKEWKYDENIFNAVSEIAKLLKRKEIKLIFVQAPVTFDLYNSYLNNSAFDAKISEYGQYYNFNETHKWNDTLDFQDFHHLNRIGVEKFNKKVLNIINNE